MNDRPAFQLPPRIVEALADFWERGASGNLVVHFDKGLAVKVERHEFEALRERAPRLPIEPIANTHEQNPLTGNRYPR